MFYQILLSPQVKQCAIITYKHDILQMPHKLPNHPKLSKFDHQGILENC